MNSTLLKLNPKQLHKLRKNFAAAIVGLCMLFVQSFSVSAQSGTIHCPADIVKNNDPGKCTAVVSFEMMTSNDPNSSIEYSRNSGAAFPIGTTRVDVQENDINGNVTSSCSFNVTVLDKEAPVLSNCSPNITAGSSATTCGAVVTFASPAMSDICIAQQKTFNYTGSPITFIVPAGVTSIRANVRGAAGGLTYYNQSVFSSGGLGGAVSGTIAVVPGQALTIYVGGKGRNGSASSAGVGGFNGGGNGTASVDPSTGAIDFAGGGGGGATDIRLGTGTDNRILVAAGGGGAGFTYAGGSGGASVGQNGAGGTSVSTGGTQSGGGSGASYNNEFFAANGTLGLGGNGATEAPAGGGGGGYYGGGGGSFGSGAGGSNYYTSGVTNVSSVQGAEEGNGLVTFQYNQSATLVQTAGLPSGSLFPLGETINTFTATDAAGNTSACTFIVSVADAQKPVVTVPAAQTFSTTASTYSIPAATATDNCSVASIQYTISGATTRSGTGADASGTFNTGTSTITYTVTDAKGNVQTGATTVTVNTAPAYIVSVNIADVWAVAPWGVANTIYIGFGPANLTYNANATNGVAPYTYAWRKAGSGTVLSTTAAYTVSAAGVYTVTATDKNGVVGTASKEIKVEDVQCGNGEDKVSICHMPVNSTDKQKTICVARSSVDKFLGNGNYLGSCKEAGASSTTEEIGLMAILPEALALQSKKFAVYPNPATNMFTVQLNNSKALKAEVLLLSQTGTIVERKIVSLSGARQNVTFNTAKIAAGMYTVKIVSEEGIQTAKVVVVH